MTDTTQSTAPTNLTGKHTAQLLHRAVDHNVTVVGTHTSPHQKRDLIGIPDADRFEHVFSGGPTGSGKTVLMQHAILQDIAKGRSTVVLNPKGDLIDDLIGKLPGDRLDAVTYIQPAADEVPAINVLEPHGVDALSATQRDTQVSVLVNTILAVFRRQSRYWGDRFGRLLAAVLRALVQDNIAIKLGERQGELNTLADVATVLQDDDELRQLIDRTDDGVLRQTLVTIRDEFDHRDLEPILRRLTDFLAPTALRDVLATSRSSIDLTDLLDTGGVLLVDVRAGEVSQHVAELLGTIILAQVWAAAQTRVTQPPDDREPAMVYIDELPMFTGQGSDLAAMLAQAREYRVGCWLACQFVDQVPKQLRNEIVQNCRTKAVFPVRQAEEGNKRVLKGIPEQTVATAKQRKYRAVLQRIDQPTITVNTLPPWPADPAVIDDRKQQIHAAETTPADTTDEQDDDAAPADVDALLPDEDVPLNLGHPAIAGNDDHQTLLNAAKHWFEQVHGLTVDLLYQEDGRERPDGVIHADSAKWHLEVECGTVSKPARVLQNLRRAHEQDRGCVFVATEDTADRVADILTDPVNRTGTDHTDDRGTYSYYQDEDGPVTDVDQLREARFRLYAATDVGLVPVTRRE